MDVERGGDLEYVLHHVLVDGVLHPAEVLASVPWRGPHHTEHCVAGEEGGAGSEELLRPGQGVDLVPGVVRQGGAPGYAGQVHGSSLLHSEHPAGRVRLAQTVCRRLRDDDVARLTEGHLAGVAVSVLAEVALTLVSPTHVSDVERTCRNSISSLSCLITVIWGSFTTFCHSFYQNNHL